MRLTILPRAAVIAFCAAILAGCGALFLPATKSILLTSEPQAAEVFVDGERRGTTPTEITLDNHASHTVTFRKEGYKDISCELTASIHGGIVVLDVLGGLIPVIVDAATGSWKRIREDRCVVQLPEE